MFQSNTLPVSYYRKVYFGLCKQIKNKLNDTTFTKDEIHSMNKVIGKIKSTTELNTENDWTTFLKTITTYWKI